MNIRQASTHKLLLTLTALLLLSGLLVGSSPAASASSDPPNPIPVTDTPTPSLPLYATLSLTSNSSSDYQIGDSGSLRAQAINASGGNLTYRWSLVEGPAQSFGDQNTTVCPDTQSTSSTASCSIPARFFGPEDVGEWTVRLTIVDGATTATDVFTLTIQGFEDDERRPTYSELSTIEPIQTWTDSSNQEAFGIKVDDWNFKSLLVYTDIPGLSYWDNPNDADLPNGERELHYMQPPLVPILERITELAKHEGISLILTDAWDQDDGHAKYSIHYEGRALDLDLPPIGGKDSDQDKAALGRLAYLAEKALQESDVEYWIWHEHNHVHLSINAEHAYDPRWGTQCSGANCLDHVQQQSDARSGAAAAAMILGFFSSDIDQNTLFAHAGSPTNGLSCPQLADLLKDYSTIDWDCIQYASREDALRATAYWLDWSQDFWGATFPAAMPFDGNYTHWVGIEGATATRIPLEQASMSDPAAGGYQVNGFFIDDASLSIVHRDMKRFAGRNALDSSFRALPGVYYGAVVATGCQSDSSSANQNTYTTTSIASEETVTGSGFCGSPVWIQTPKDNSSVEAGNSQLVEVSTVFGASNVHLHVDGQTLSPSGGNGLSTYDFLWQVPSTPGQSYALQASAQVNGTEQRSTFVNVTSNGEAPDPLSLQFTNLADDGTVSTGEPISVEVSTQSIETVLLKIEPDDDDRMEDGRGWMDTNGEDHWVSNGTWIPQKEGQYYTLIAIGYADVGSETISEEITVQAMPDDPTIDVADSVTLNQSTTVKVLAPGAYDVTLHADGSKTLIKAGYDPNTQSGDGVWEYEWTPNVTGQVEVVAYVNYDFQATKYPSKTVTVVDEGQNAIIVEITEPKDGASVVRGQSTTVNIESPGELTKVDLEITDSEGNVTHKIVTADDVDGNFASICIPWKPAVTGLHSLKATGWNPSGQLGWTDPLIFVNAVEPQPIDPSEQGTWTWINDWSFLWKNEKDIRKLGEAGYFDPNYYNTLIPYDQYVCGIVGLSGKGGDIGEDFNLDPMDAYLTTWYKDKTDSWQIMLDFNTLNKGFWHWIYEYDFDDKPETWDAQLMCFDRSVASEGGPEAGKPIFLKQLAWHESNVNVDTGIAVDQYTCGIVGFNTTEGDLNEKGTGDILRNDLYSKDGEWWLRADFHTHDGEHESWQHTILCVDNTWAAMSTPEAGKPFVFTSYDNMGDNVNKLTEFRTDEWTCGLTGYSALNGDIDEGESGDDSNLLLAYMYEDTSQGKWRLRTDFRTHNDGETWNADVMCVAKEGVSITSAEPYIFQGIHTGDNKVYGPGMKVDFSDSHDPDANFYRVQYSTTGSDPWHDIYTAPRNLSEGSYQNHHGDYNCGWEQIGYSSDYRPKYGHCLASQQQIYYRVGLLVNAGDTDPINDNWSQPVAGTTYDWPASFQTHVTDGVKRSDYTWYAINLTNRHGPEFRVTWEVQSVLGAYGVKSGCDTKTCTIKVYPPPARTSNSSVVQPTSVEPEQGVTVIVTATDKVFQDGVYIVHSYHESVFLPLEPEDGGGTDDPINDRVFADLTSSDWAYPYFNDLYNQGYISGYEEDGQVFMKPDNSATRSESSVTLVRAWHQNPEYIPSDPEVEEIYFEDLKPVSELNSLSMAEPAPVALAWNVKWDEENYALGITSGCSADPPRFCGEQSTTRAQAVTFFVKTLYASEFKPPEISSSSFQDVSMFNPDGSSAWAPKWIEQALQDGIIQECGTDMLNMLFRPDDAATRSELMCMLHHTLDAKGALE